MEEESINTQGLEQTTTFLTIDNIGQLKANVQAAITADLENYYTKSEVDQQVSAIPKFSIEVVDTLPTENISDTTLYLVPASGQGPDVYTEYIHVGDQWEQLGVQTVDLSDYYTKTEADAAFVATDDLVLTSDEQTKLKKVATTNIVTAITNVNNSTATQAKIDRQYLYPNTGQLINSDSNLPMASDTKAGCMTATDKTKLDNLANIQSVSGNLELANGVLSTTGGLMPDAEIKANNLPTYVAGTLSAGFGGKVLTDWEYGSDYATPKFSWMDLVSGASSTQDGSTLSNATSDYAGLMSAADKTKLDGLSNAGFTITELPVLFFPESGIHVYIANNDDLTITMIGFEPTFTRNSDVGLSNLISSIFTVPTGLHPLNIVRDMQYAIAETEAKPGTTAPDRFTGQYIQANLDGTRYYVSVVPKATYSLTNIANGEWSGLKTLSEMAPIAFVETYYS